jgi:hypothetical protein
VSNAFVRAFMTVALTDRRDHYHHIWADLPTDNGSLRDLSQFTTLTANWSEQAQITVPVWSAPELGRRTFQRLSA